MSRTTDYYLKTRFEIQGMWLGEYKGSKVANVNNKVLFCQDGRSETLDSINSIITQMYMYSRSLFRKSCYLVEEINFQCPRY